MDRVFLDANILFAASYRPESVLAQLWKIRGIRLLTSAYALGESWRNIEDTKQGLRLALLLDAVELVGELPAHETIARSVGLPDKDVPILQAAISGRATHLLTADLQHFGPLFSRTIAGVLILPPVDYLRSKRNRTGIQKVFDFVYWLTGRPSNLLW